MVDVYRTRQVPDSARIRRAMPWFAPIKATTKLCQPAKNSSVLVDNANANPISAQNYRAFTEKQSCQHAFIRIGSYVKGQAAESNATAYPILAYEFSGSIAVNIESIGYLGEARPRPVVRQDFMSELRKHTRSNRRSQQNIMAEQQASDGARGTLILHSQIVEGRTLDVSVNDLLRLSAQRWRDRLSLNHQDSLLRIKYRCRLISIQSLFDQENQMPEVKR